MSRILNILLFTFQVYYAFTQDCKIRWGVKVMDHHDDHPLEFATLFIQETGNAYTSNVKGEINIGSMCPGEYHITIHHFGCDPVKIYMSIHRDTNFTVLMEHHAHTLQSVEVSDYKSKNTGASKHTLHSKEIQSQSDQPLASILQNIIGVQSLKNGTTIAIPIIQGLTGTRITLVNNGIIQSAQQWGADHAPEIDPFAASEIKVIKGVDAISYGGNGLGGMILMEPGPILKDPHLHGNVQSIYRTNGRSYHIGLKLEQSTEKIDWRLTASGKLSGDHSTPNYYLSNTGTKDFAISALGVLQKKPSKLVKYYYSLFHSSPGLLRGSHIGNLSDLKEALGRDIPFFTKNNFSYQIEAPRQNVSHHLLKASFQWDLDHRFRELQFAGQWNSRKEYDVRRSGKSDIPALSLNLLSSHLIWNERFDLGNQQLSYGISHRFNINTANKETGIIPLIPDYFLNNAGLYTKWNLMKEQFQLEAGLRYDLNHFKVDYIDRSIPPSIQKIQKFYHNYSIASGAIFNLDPVTIAINSGWTQRSPEIHELFSNGLHQSVAGIEEGDPGLKQESSFKTQLTGSLLVEEWLSAEAGIWIQSIKDYIFLEPQLEPRLTIRGAFPVYLYKQTDARLYGIDLTFRFEFNHKWQMIHKFSYLRGQETSGTPLVYMPPHQLSGSLHRYILPGKKFRKLDLFVSASYHFRQNHYSIKTDFLEPPPAYLLITAGIDTEMIIFDQKWHIGLEIDNLWNERYRDYLNRLRYFADEEGRSFRILLKMEF
ncbi:MAG: TonB-dependent receptor [Saprospiraceae bacterium]|nr:TonB-dependent receptor [Saprospiraceae bacterium]